MLIGIVLLAVLSVLANVCAGYRTGVWRPLPRGSYMVRTLVLDVVLAAVYMLLLGSGWLVLPITVALSLPWGIAAEHGARRAMARGDGAAAEAKG